MRFINMRMNDGPDCVTVFGNLGFTLPPDIGTLPDPCQVDLSKCDLVGELPLSVIRIKLKWWCRVTLADNNGLTLPADLSPIVQDVRSYGREGGGGVAGQGGVVASSEATPLPPGASPPTAPPPIPTPFAVLRRGQVAAKRLFAHRRYDAAWCTHGAWPPRPLRPPGAENPS